MVFVPGVELAGNRLVAITQPTTWEPQESPQAPVSEEVEEDPEDPFAF